MQNLNNNRDGSLMSVKFASVISRIKFGIFTLIHHLS